MKAFRLMILAQVAIALSMGAYGFDSAKWLQKRDLMSADAVRLQSVYTNLVSRVTTPSEGLSIPLETYPNGAVRTSLFARRAQTFDKNELIWVDGLLLKKLDEDGVEKLRLEADLCVVDRKRKCGWIEGHAKVTQGKTVFEGDRVYFSSSNNFVTAYSNSDIKSEDLKFGGVK